MQTVCLVVYKKRKVKNVLTKWFQNNPLCECVFLNNIVNILVQNFINFKSNVCGRTEEWIDWSNKLLHNSYQRIRLSIDFSSFFIWFYSYGHLIIHFCHWRRCLSVIHMDRVERMYTRIHLTRGYLKMKRNVLYTYQL